MSAPPPPGAPADANVPWHALDAAEVARRLGTDPARGLSSGDAATRLAEHGPNELARRAGRGRLAILREQLASPTVLLLIAAAAISAFVGDRLDAGVILAIVVLNAAIGVRQEYRAERAIAALQRLAVPRLRARRDGHMVEISAREVVPGDIVALEAGSAVPADARLIEAAALRAQEAALTGESEPVDKDPDASPPADAGLGDRPTMVHMGTVIVYGRGLAMVTATGMNTALGRIADLLQQVEQEPTPLQRRLDHLGRVLALVAVGLVGLVFVLGLARGEELRVLFLTALSLAVAAVPEGLPAIVTIALTLGAERMLARRALIRRLAAVETLGSVTVICSDKTGTLTENRMTVTVLDVAGARIELRVALRDGARSAPDPELRREIEARPTLALLLAGAALANDAEVERPDGRFEAIGDPTETALVIAAAQAGMAKPELERALPRVSELPFDSQRKRMTTVHRVEDRAPPDGLARAPAWLGAARQAGEVAFTKGAVESVLAATSHVWVERGAEPLTEVWRRRILAAQDQLAQQGVRVLGVAFRPVEARRAPAGEGLEADLTFVGIIGMIDPPRPEAGTAVQAAKAAGIHPIMITGDHPLTAREIAQRLDISRGDRVLTGRDLDRLSSDELTALAEQVSVYARVSPEDKLTIVEALQRRGHVVAMTGDGVNDAPALRRADIGVAMGITGTDVAKEAADMVLQDDNFATIVAAVEEGRVIYENIRKFIRYILSANSGELWVMLLGPLLGMPLPLLPLQILWMNLVTDSLPALALGLERAEPDLMRRPPRRPDESIFARGLGPYIVTVGLLMAIAGLALGYTYWRAGRDDWQTLVFTTLVFSQMAIALSARSDRLPVTRLPFFGNPALLGAIAIGIALQLAVLYVSFLQPIFDTVPLAPAEVALAGAASVLVLVGADLVKWVLARRAGWAASAA